MVMGDLHQRSHPVYLMQIYSVPAALLAHSHFTSIYLCLPLDYKTFLYTSTSHAVSPRQRQAATLQHSQPLADSTTNGSAHRIAKATSKHGRPHHLGPASGSCHCSCRCWSTNVGIGCCQHHLHLHSRSVPSASQATWHMSAMQRTLVYDRGTGYQNQQ